jgi:hypothetical protein
MKRKIFTLFFCCTIAFTYGQAGSDFGPNDVLLCNFENVTLVAVDSLWTDSTMTTAITTPSANVSIADNPFPVENESEKAAKYVRPEGSYKSIFLRFDKSITLSKTPYLQVQVYPVAGKSPVTSKIDVSLINDKGDIVSGAGSMQNMPQDEWTTVSVFLGRLKSSDLYNAIQITINSDDSLSILGGTEYYIDQIGFKAPVDGIELPSTIFYETFGVYNDNWQNGKIEGQYKIPNSDGTGFDGPGEIGTADAYASIGGFSSGIPFTYKDVNADTATAVHVRTWGGMTAKYEGASSNGHFEFAKYRTGTLETGDIDVSGNTDFNLSFGIGTQTWWPYNSEIANARPKVEISVDGGAFYEIFSESTFLQFTGEQVDLGWGLMDKYEDQIFVLVEYPFTTVDGLPLDSAQTINLRMSYKAGETFWIDDLWLSAKVAETTELSHDANFLTFALAEQVSDAVINVTNAKVTCTVAKDQDISALTTTFTYSPGAQVSPTAGITNFTSPVTYEITAQDGTTKKQWVVSVERADNVAENTFAAFAIYPNPVKDQITLSGIENANHIVVSNLMGQALMETNNVKEAILVADLHAGLYLITVYDDQGNFRTEKFIKE